MVPAIRPNESIKQGIVRPDTWFAPEDVVHLMEDSQRSIRHRILRVNLDDRQGNVFGALALLSSDEFDEPGHLSDMFRSGKESDDIMEDLGCMGESRVLRH
ncbi:hypothetical protein NE237_000337 [Protea cynaroides]|uniref:Uncharacterized protein n=1 Tax=Protea cynaroides TaxID=273540 RepID=A0A9Q0KS20_9MAGN|nr:hypothetical protein NE237_000337 [Protea cynaroides]